MKTGRCKLKKNITSYINGVNLGRGKKFNYKYVSSDKVIVYKKGISIYTNDKQFLKDFEILTRGSENER